MSSAKPNLVFISTIFLFPTDAGGKIRTTNILRGLKGGRFKIILLCPATSQQQEVWSNELNEICDEFLSWEPRQEKPRWQRLGQLLSQLPVNVANDKTIEGVKALKELNESNKFDLVVFDFVHSAVLWPRSFEFATVCFTHNVESEIFKRHAEQANNAISRFVWKSQQIKMQKFESANLKRFSSVIAVSDRDALFFQNHYGIETVHSIPTGVDLDFYGWKNIPLVSDLLPPTVIFTGSMNWYANLDGVGYFLDNIWPLVIRIKPNARFLIVGRDPPNSLLAKMRHFSNVEITGFVDDVREYVYSAHVFVIPLRVGGGTRIKAFESMAMGCPVVSTSIGVEGLDVLADKHYLCRDTPETFASAIIDLLENYELREKLSICARGLVEQYFSHKVAASVFEEICYKALLDHNSVQ